MNEKINELIENYISLRREDPNNENEVYKWHAIDYFQQHWDINAADFYEMFKESFKKRGNLVHQNPFSFLDALGRYFPEQLRSLFIIVYGSDNFYTKLDKAKSFAENNIEELRKKLNKTSFNHQFDERTLSFLLTMQNPTENTFYKKDIYINLCKYLNVSPQKEEKYYHCIKLLKNIIAFFNKEALLSAKKKFVPNNFDFPLLLAQDIVYQNIAISSEEIFRNVLNKIPTSWASVFFYKLGAIIDDLELEDTENQVFSVRLDEKILRYHIGKRICLSVSPKEFLFITGSGVDIPKLRKEEFERPNNAFLYYQGRPLHIEEYYTDIKNAIKEEIKLDKETYPKSYDNAYFREYMFLQKYKEEFEITENNMEKQAIDLTTINLLRYKPQIILQGPPGTGKTREAKRIAKALLGLGENDSLEGNEQFKLIQFHPSYSYEDFVRGIIADNTNSNISYVTKDKILADFAKKAFKAPLLPIKWEDFRDFLEKERKEKGEVYFDGDSNLKYESIKDGKLFYSSKRLDTIQYNEDTGEITELNDRNFDLVGIHIEAFCQKNLDDNFISFKKNQKKQEGYWNTITDYFIKWANNFKKKKPYVLVIDEINRANLSAVLGELIYALEYRGEAVQSMYAIEGENNLILPPNLYIIGTMNTADRSVGHIDYAIRRRFAFVNILPKDLTNELGDQFESALFAKVTNLFNTNLSSEFKKEEVQLGHSYFITKNTPIDIRWEYEIKPILLEYVKDGILVGEGIETTINNLINNENYAS